MKTIFIRDEVHPDCPIRNVLARFSGKWSLLVLHTLRQSAEPVRFNMLLRAIPDVSQKMLTQTLRTLEEDGLVQRRVFAEVPPRVEYALTARAESLLPHIYALIGWAKENMDSIIFDRVKYQNHIK